MRRALVMVVFLMFWLSSEAIIIQLEKLFFRIVAKGFVHTSGELVARDFLLSAPVLVFSRSGKAIIYHGFSHVPSGIIEHVSQNSLSLGYRISGEYAGTLARQGETFLSKFECRASQEAASLRLSPKFCLELPQTDKLAFATNLSKKEGAFLRKLADEYCQTSGNVPHCRFFQTTFRSPSCEKFAFKHTSVKDKVKFIHAKALAARNEALRDLEETKIMFAEASNARAEAYNNLKNVLENYKKLSSHTEEDARVLKEAYDACKKVNQIIENISNASAGVVRNLDEKVIELETESRNLNRSIETRLNEALRIYNQQVSGAANELSRIHDKMFLDFLDKPSDMAQQEIERINNRKSNIFLYLEREVSRVNEEVSASIRSNNELQDPRLMNVYSQLRQENVENVEAEMTRILNEQKARLQEEVSEICFTELKNAETEASNACLRVQANAKNLTSEFYAEALAISHREIEDAINHGLINNRKGVLRVYANVLEETKNRALGFYASKGDDVCNEIKNIYGAYLERINNRVENAFNQTLIHQQAIVEHVEPHPVISVVERNADHLGIEEEEFSGDYQGDYQTHLPDIPEAGSACLHVEKTFWLMLGVGLGVAGILHVAGVI